MRKKIFVTKQGGIGDVILATPILSELKKQYPDSYITLMIFSNAYDIVKGLLFIDEIFIYNKKKDGFLKLWNKMRGYDIAIYLDLSYCPALAGALARIPIRIGVSHKRGFWLTKEIPWQSYMDHTYEPYVMGDIVNAGLDLNISHEALNRLYIASATEFDKKDLAKKLNDSGVKMGDRYVVSSPITAFYLKNWPLDNWNELFKKIYHNYGLKNVIFGKEKLDYQWDEKAVIDLCGMLSLRQLGELVRNADLLVNSCSMPIHLSAATGTPCVVLYGYTDPCRWAPRMHCKIVKSDLPCSPCDGYHGSKCTDPLCMKRLSVEEVYKSCQEILSNDF